MPCHVACTNILPSTLTTVLLLIGMLTTLGGAVYAFLLSRETEHEDAWLILAFGLTFYAVHQFLIIPWVFGIFPERIHVYADQVSLLIASILTLTSLIMLYKQLKRVRV